MRAAILLALALLGGCAAIRARGAEGKCNADPAQSLVGQAYDKTLGERARKLSHADTLRVIPPGTMITQDYRADRLNIYTDEAGKVARFNCS